MRQIMRSSLEYTGFAQLCGRSPIMREIMRAHNFAHNSTIPSSSSAVSHSSSNVGVSGEQYALYD